ncbi:MAG: hypothetical protein MJY44_01690 [Bacteroidales bacterium]|nr:hypothetical protein [Bacteroidales bacterium]
MKFFKKGQGLSLRQKTVLSLSSIAVVLLISSTISVMEFDAMSTYVSDLIADDINSINVAHRLSDLANSYNLQILAVIGDEGRLELPESDDGYFLSHCDTLRSSVPSNEIAHLADSVVYSYTAYMLTSKELENVLYSDFIDSREWYFNRLQPRFSRLTSDIDALVGAIYGDLQKNSETFDRGFYRSVIPGIVAVGVGLLLVLMLMFFLLAYYVNPIYRMLDSLRFYRSFNKQYNLEFEGDDQLSELNGGIREVVNENRELRRHLLSQRKKESAE